MKASLCIIALIASFCLGGTALAQQLPAQQPIPQQSPSPDLGHTPKLALMVLQAEKHGTLTVSSPTFKDGGEIPEENTQYGKNIFPGVAWTAGPRGTRSYLIMIQGEAYGTGPTTIQFSLLNVPATITSLAAGMTEPPTGAMYGPNVHGASKPYAGPHTHTGDRHGYHVEVFALDTLLKVPSTVNFDGLMAAATGHVLASGDLTCYTAKPEGAVYQPNRE
jgi:para-nitrobenzyl esterase